MPPTARFADINFNLMRAIEFFEDMNYLDMDVMAPSSSHTFFKEIEVAQRLNIFLSQLIEEGVFDDCDLRDQCSSEEEDGEAEEQEDGVVEEEEETSHSHEPSRSESDLHRHSHSHSHSHPLSGPHSDLHSHPHSDLHSDAHSDPYGTHSHSHSGSHSSISPRSEGFSYRGGRGSADTEYQVDDFVDEN